MEKMQMMWVKTFFGWKSFWNPEKAAAISFKVFQKVRKKSVRDREKGFFDRATHFTLPYKDRQLDCYEIGYSEDPIVVLVHGWESNAGCMTKIIDGLLAKNKRIITFNLPGHAFDPYAYSNLVECSEAFKILVDWIGPNQPLDVISHSFGSAVVAMTFDKYQLQANNLVFLTNPNHIENIFIDFKNLIGLNKKAYSKLQEIIINKLGEPIENISVEDQITRISMNRLLLIHDTEDKIIPYQNALAIKDKIPTAELHSISNVGHYKMLWNNEVVEKAVGFVN